MTDLPSALHIDSFRSKFAVDTTRAHITLSSLRLYVPCWSESKRTLTFATQTDE